MCDFFGREMLLNYFLLGLMFPAATAVLPLFIQIRDFGLLDTYWGVILPKSPSRSRMSILLFREFFRAAADRVCSRRRSSTAAATRASSSHDAAVFPADPGDGGDHSASCRSWNNYLLPLIMLDSESKYPWPLGIMVYQGEFSTEWQAGSGLRDADDPAGVIVFFAAQRHIVSGLTATDLLDLVPDSRVLEIGTGSGYQTAVLAELAEQVWSVEVIEGLSQRAARVLADLGYLNVNLRVGDGNAGWPEAAPFDAIIVTAAAPSIPQALVGQLAAPGRMVIPVGVPLRTGSVADREGCGGRASAPAGDAGGIRSAGRRRD